ncbi:MAG: hypothetical protein R3E98_01280 [Gemmatimonadota bacterium]
MLKTKTDPALDHGPLRRTIIRSAADAVQATAPLDVIDPRGMIFDRAPDDQWTLRVRGSDRQRVLGLGSGPQVWDRADRFAWTELPLDEDDALPGRRLPGDPHALGDLLGTAEAVDVAPVTYRRGRRAVLRVVERSSGRTHYVKLLSRKAWRKADRALQTARSLQADAVLQPRVAEPSRALLVFDALQMGSLHDRLWAGERVDLEPLLEGMRRFAALTAPVDLPRRDLETERSAAARQLRTSLDFLPALGSLLAAVERVEPLRLPGDGLVHGDLHDKQIFLSGDRLRLIDAESLASGSPLLDVVNLAEHLRLRGLQGCEGAPGAAERLWRQAALDPADPAIRQLRGLVRARLAAVYARRPWWWDLALEIARDAGDLLGQRP